MDPSPTNYGEEFDWDDWQDNYQDAKAKMSALRNGLGAVRALFGWWRTGWRRDQDDVIGAGVVSCSGCSLRSRWSVGWRLASGVGSLGGGSRIDAIEDWRRGVRRRRWGWMIGSWRCGFHRDRCHIVVVNKR